MNFKKLAAWLTLSVTAATPLAIAQNPTILQGNYITNVFGNSNFVLNPNAQTNVADVTNATRSTTTPLVATSEFNLSLASGANATWTLRAFDQGMKGQNCEARFTYRGFATATTKAELVQNSLVVASLTLTPTTDPRIASINFPCGDLAHLTTFRIAQTTANMTTVTPNEIGAIYTGLATNMANVAQAEAVGGYKITVAGTKPGTTSASFANLTSGTATQVLFGKATSSDAASGSVTFSSLPAGNYMIAYTTHSNSAAATSCQYQWYEDTSAVSSGFQYNNGDTNWSMVPGYFEFTSAASRTFRIQGKRSAGSNTCQIDHAVNGQIVVYRFPSSSELVVTPERQNVFGGVVYTNQNQILFGTTAEPTAFSPYTNATWNQPTLLKGKALVTTTNSGNDLGFSIPNMPVGTYKVTISGVMNAVNSSDGIARCNYKIVETTTSTDVARQISQDMSFAAGSLDETRDYTNSFFGVYANTSVATRNFRLEAQKFDDTTTGNVGYCQAYSGTGSNTYNTNIAFLLEPLDQPSNSALYVQGPVLGSNTGAAIPAGSLGQTITWVTVPTTTSFTTSASDWTNAFITLQPGVYYISAQISMQANAGSTVNNDVECIVSLTDSTGTIVNNQSRSIRTRAYVTGVAALLNAVTPLSAIVNVTAANTIYKIRGQLQNNTGTGACQFFNVSNQYSDLYAVKLN